MDIRIKYHDDAIQRIKQIDIGNWIDLYNAEPISMRAGEIAVVSTGVSIELPAGYEALVGPRSSTILRYGLIMGNSIGIIDTTYCGDDDVWKQIWYATRDIQIPAHTRLAQFRIIESMPKINLIEVDHLQGPNRGGCGSTGV